MSRNVLLERLQAGEDGMPPWDDAALEGEMNLVERLRFDAARCEAAFSKGVAENIEEAAAEIERLSVKLQSIENMAHGALLFEKNAEIERLRAEVNAKDKEIERLKTELDNINVRTMEMCAEIDHLREVIAECGNLAGNVGHGDEREWMETIQKVARAALDPQK
jgi:chromosome segregation ATPase